MKKGTAKLPRRVLVITYNYPPSNTIGARRISKFTKYLPNFDWDVHVLTVKPHAILPHDAKLEIHSEFITQTKTIDPISDFKKMLHFDRDNNLGGSSTSTGGNFGLTQLRKQFRKIANTFVPDRSIGWYYYAVKAGKQICSQKHFDLIFSSCLPPTSHLIASRLQKILHVPWVADYRDLWSNNYAQDHCKLYTRIEKAVERKICNNAACFITVSHPLSSYLKVLHGRPVHVVPNGFDPDDFPAIDVLPKREVFSIVYTGQIYPGKQDPSPLFEAVACLREKGIILHKKFELVFFGQGLGIVRDLANKFGISDLVKLPGYVKITESLQAQIQATVLLLLPWKEISQEGVLTGKIFEYLGSGRPILSIGPEDGSIEKLLCETGAGISARDVEDIKKVLISMTNQYYQTGQVLTYRHESVIQKYTSCNITNRLASLFDRLIENA